MPPLLAPGVDESAVRRRRPGAAPAGAATVVDSAVTRWVLRVVGLAVAAYVTWAAVAGPDTLTNPVFGWAYVLLWVGLVPASLLLGPVLRALNLLRTLLRLLSALLRSDPEAGAVPLPQRVELPRHGGLVGQLLAEVPCSVTRHTGSPAATAA